MQSEEFRKPTVSLNSADNKNTHTNDSFYSISNPKILSTILNNRKHWAVESITNTNAGH